MNMIPVCAVGIFAVICSAALRKTNPEIAALIPVSAVVMIALLMLPYAESAVAAVSGFSEKAMINETYLKALIRSVGICYITQITADICRENGSASTASQVELYGKLAILLIACPLYRDMLELVTRFMK